MAVSRKRKRRNQRSSKRGAWIGNVLLELVAFVALLFVLAMSSHSQQQKEADQLSYRSTGVTTAFTAFLQDSFEYQKGIQQ